MFKKTILLSAAATAVLFGRGYNCTEEIGCDPNIIWSDFSKNSKYEQHPPVQISRANYISNWDNGTECGLTRKIQIRQEIPCFIVPDNAETKDYKKIDDHTVEIPIKVGNWQFTSMNRRGLLNYFTRDPKSKPEPYSAADSIQILGDSYECMNRENFEVWTEICEETNKTAVIGRFKTIP